MLDDERLGEWHEVPQARFLSWTPGEQAAYCAARDLDSAAREVHLEWVEFYLARARAYSQQITATKIEEL